MLKQGQHLSCNKRGELVPVWAPLSNLGDVAFEVLRWLPLVRFVTVDGYHAMRHRSENLGEDCVMMSEAFARAFIAYQREESTS